LNIIQLSVGSSGNVWAVTWDGKAVYRDGVDHCNPSGKFIIIFIKYVS